MAIDDGTIVTRREKKIILNNEAVNEVERLKLIIFFFSSRECESKDE